MKCEMCEVEKEGMTCITSKDTTGTSDDSFDRSVWLCNRLCFGQFSKTVMWDRMQFYDISITGPLSPLFDDKGMEVCAVCERVCDKANRIVLEYRYEELDVWYVCEEHKDRLCLDRYKTRIRCERCDIDHSKRNRNVNLILYRDNQVFDEYSFDVCGVCAGRNVRNIQSVYMKDVVGLDDERVKFYLNSD